MKGETCVRTVPRFNYRTVSLVSDFSKCAQVIFAKGSLLEMPYGHFLSAISAFVPNNSGGNGGKGSVMKTLVSQTHVGSSLHLKSFFNDLISGSKYLNIKGSLSLVWSFSLNC